jgi:putative oxidoreductase
MLVKLLSPLAPYAYPLLRVFAGLMFAQHGAQKLFGVLGGKVQPEFSLLWFAGVIELGGGLLIALGLFTRIAAFLASGQMAVAYVKSHWKFAFDDQFFPIINKGELALLFCFVFFCIACSGPGKFCLDGLIWKKRPL